MKQIKSLLWPQFDRAVDQAVLDVIHSGRVNYWTGSKGREFESVVAKYLGVRRALAVSNGSLALELALLALGVGRGDEVVVTPYSFRASATAAARVGAKMVFADVGDDHLLSARTIERVLTKRTKAIIVVHLYGQVAEMKPILTLAKKRKLFVIEDCAQCLGGEYEGRKVGTWGDVGCFSFCQSKHVTTGGEGGLVVAKRAEVLRRVESLRDHGWVVGSEPKEFDLIGTNARLTEIQSAIGLVEMKRFATWNLPRRRRLAAELKKRLSVHPLVLRAPVDTARRRASFWLMPFVLDETKLSIPVSMFIERLQKKGAFVYKIMWPLLKKTPTASKLIRNTIGFWVHPTLTLKDMKKTITLFNSLFASVALAGETILFTNDTHAHVDDGAVTFSQIAAYRADLDARGENPILVDCGDVVQGTAFAKIDSSVPLVELMNAAGYQAGILGNHEFDYGLPASIERAKSVCKFPVVACNFWKTNILTHACDQLLPAYTVVTTKTARVGFVGVATPESITSSTPKNFMDATGSYYLYGFNGGRDGRDLFRHVQDAVNDVAKISDYVVVLSHLGLGKTAGLWRSVDLIEHTTNFVALLDGHSHSVADTNVLNLAGEPVRLVQSGCHLHALGSLRIENGKIEKVELLNKLGRKDPVVEAQEKKLAARVEAWLGEKLAVADDDLYRYLPDRDACGETGLGDFVADAYYWYANAHAKGGCDMAFNNYSGIRSNVKKGDFKLRTANDVCPFGNGVCLIEATGADIREALEWGSRRYPGYAGGFFHAAGIRYFVDTSIVSTVRSKEGMWAAGPRDGVYRVKKIEVYNRAKKKFEPLKLKKTYRVAGCDYTLMNGGNGYQMLKNCKVVDPCLKTDYLALAEYAKAFKKGPDGVPHLNAASSPLAVLPGYPIDYASRTGAGRIAPLH